MRLFCLTTWFTLSMAGLSCAFSSLSLRHDAVRTVYPVGLRPKRSLHAKRKPTKSNLSTSIASPMDSFMKMMIPGRGPSSMESSIQAALILTDKKRQEEWKKDMRQQFPLVPGFAVDICIDSLSDAFSTIAPAELKAALRPGGLDKVRPDLEAKIVKNLEKQDVMKKIPLHADDKQQFLKHMVALAFDYMLKDAELILAEPSVRLQALEAQKQEITTFMTSWQLTWYRIRHFPIRMGIVGVASAYIGISVYQQTKHTVIVSTVTGLVLSMYSAMKTLATKMSSLLGLGKVKSWRKKGVRRVVRR